jgi:hypothetical protein
MRTDVINYTRVTERVCHAHCLMSCGWNSSVSLSNFELKQIYSHSDFTGFFSLLLCSIVITLCVRLKPTFPTHKLQTEVLYQ